MSDRILVTGDRDWTDEWAIHEVLDYEVPNAEAIIEGNAPGADKIAGTWAKRQILKLKLQNIGTTMEHLTFPAEWMRYRKAGRKNPAGPIRNKQMLDEGKPTLVVAFHDNLQESKGTYDMIRQSLKAGLRVLHYSHEEGLHEYESSRCRER